MFRARGQWASTSHESPSGGGADSAGARVSVRTGRRAWTRLAAKSKPRGRRRAVRQHAERSRHLRHRVADEKSCPDGIHPFHRPNPSRTGSERLPLLGFGRSPPPLAAPVSVCYRRPATATDGSPLSSPERGFVHSVGAVMSGKFLTNPCRSMSLS